MFSLGNFNIDEVLYGTAQDFDGTLLYTLDQLSSASIEISSDSTDITDKNGNVVRTIYKTKSGSFNSTNAFLHPQVMNAASGSAIEEASSGAPIVMPKIEVIKAGATLNVTNAKEGTIQVIGLYGSGANSHALEAATDAPSGQYPAAGYYYISGSTTKTLAVPAAATGAPVSYLVKYDREVTDGWKLKNLADNFPQTVRLTLFCSYVDPCEDSLRACYVYLPSFQADPAATISLDRESQEMDFNGSMQVDYCDAEKALYYIYFPNENAVTTGVVA